MEFLYDKNHLRGHPKYFFSLFHFHFWNPPPPPPVMEGPVKSPLSVCLTVSLAFFSGIAH